jgi:starvation-inducible DNA-binding protein
MQCGEREKNMHPSQPDTPGREPVEHSQQIGSKALVAICSELKLLLADVFAIYVKTKNFHWHMTGPHFRDYHLLLDEHGDQLFAMTDPIAERSRKLAGDALRSIGDIARHQRIRDNDQEGLAPEAMLQELLVDNRMLADNLRTAHAICEQFGDVATSSLIENWIDESERRSWFLRQIIGS